MTDATTNGHSCFGFGIRSALDLRYLRLGSGDAELEVKEVESLGPEPEMQPAWTLRAPDGSAFGRLFDLGGNYRFIVRDIAEYLVDPVARSISVTPSHDHRLREAYLWGIPVGLCFVQRGDLPLHSAAVQVGDSALIFGAPGKFGKTTLASAFLRRGYRLLSEDLACCRLTEHPALVPGPAFFRVRKDSFERLELPGTRVVAEYATRVHLALDQEARGDCSPVPIAGVVLLREAPELWVERVSGTKALKDLWILSYKLRRNDDIARSFHGLADLAARVPLYNLYRPLKYEHLDSVIDELIARCL